MLRHTFRYDFSQRHRSHYVIEREDGDRKASEAALVALSVVSGSEAKRAEVLRLLCYLLDALAVRDAEGLAPADWVEIGSDEEYEEDLYAEAYDEGFRDGSAAAFDLLGDEDEDELSDDDYCFPNC